MTEPRKQRVNIETEIYIYNAFFLDLLLRIDLLKCIFSTNTEKNSLTRVLTNVISTPMRAWMHEISFVRSSQDVRIYILSPSRVRDMSKR